MILIRILSWFNVGSFLTLQIAQALFVWNFQEVIVTFQRLRVILLKKGSYLKIIWSATFAILHQLIITSIIPYLRRLRGSRVTAVTWRQAWDCADSSTRQERYWRDRIGRGSGWRGRQSEERCKPRLTCRKTRRLCLAQAPPEMTRILPTVAWIKMQSFKKFASRSEHFKHHHLPNL